MKYLIVDDDIITNVIVTEADFAESIGALAWYEGAEIGQAYAPPTEPSQLDRVEAQAIYTALLTDTLIEEDSANV